MRRTASCPSRSRARSRSIRAPQRTSAARSASAPGARCSWPRTWTPTSWAASWSGSATRSSMPQSETHWSSCAGTLPKEPLSDMQINPDEITSILKSRIEGLDGGKAELTEVGTVLSVADGLARVHGLENCMSFEMLDLPHGVTGLALNLESDNVGAVLFGDWERISEGDTVKRTGTLLEVPVGEQMLGRIVGPPGRPRDGTGGLS